jgi:hypothetical protein
LFTLITCANFIEDILSKYYPKDVDKFDHFLYSLHITFIYYSTKIFYW